MWLGEVLGGPDDYTRRRGGYPQTLAHHVGKAITEQQRRRCVNLLLDAADEAGLPGDPELWAAFVGYIEWGTRLALHNSQPGAVTAAHAPCRAGAGAWPRRTVAEHTATPGRPR
jgi:truncated hemoglobin YjbI